jgi:hypothetical protein
MNKSKKQKPKKQPDKPRIVREERPTANLHPLFSGMFKQMFPHAYGGK